MNHIVVNNYTNAGLSILFLLVVYSIIFYGVKTALAYHKNPKRTDRGNALRAGAAGRARRRRN